MADEPGRYRGPYSGKSKPKNGSQLHPIVPNIPHKPYLAPVPPDGGEARRPYIIPVPKTKVSHFQKYAKANGKSWLGSWKG